MPFDATEGILKGLYGGVLIAIDENDAVAVSKTANTDGNAVVEINGTPSTGLCAVMALAGPSSTEAALLFGDEANITIEASDELDRGWVTVAVFPEIFYNVAEMSVTATTAFVAGDVAGTLTQETTADTGLIIAFETAIETIGGVGKILVSQVDAGDIFNQTAGKTLTSSVTGVGTKTYGAGTTTFPNSRYLPGVYVVRFVTNKKYVRCNAADVEDSIGKGYILLTDNYSAPKRSYLFTPGTA
jgi:hypothetical protein